MPLADLHCKCNHYSPRTLHLPYCPFSSIDPSELAEAIARLEAAEDVCKALAVEGITAPEQIATLSAFERWRSLTR